LVGFTAFSQAKGEEAAFRLMQALARMMSGVVGDFGGSVQGFTIDGIMAVFGAPRAHEDAPIRACRAALGIERLQSEGDAFLRDFGTRPMIRVGLNVGPVVMAEFEGRLTVLGDTVSFASRLQALAEPDRVTISEAVHELLKGAIEDSLIGEKIIKGREGAEKIYERARVAPGPRGASGAGRAPTTFVGRERELEALEKALERKRALTLVGDVVGDPGIGKSRLVA
jgi:class 3 adenylate cyclase